MRCCCKGLKLERFDASGASLGEAFTNNPAWVLLDVLRRSGWLTTEIDLASFAAAAAYCDEPIATTDLYGNAMSTSAVRMQSGDRRTRRSAAEVAKGIRNGSSLMLTYGTGRAADTARGEHAGAAAAGEAGWQQQHGDARRRVAGVRVQRRVGDVFGDSAEGERRSGDSAVGSQAERHVANRLTVEFQDEFNEYQQDSLSLVDVDDALLTEREGHGDVRGAGIAEFRSGDADAALQLDKSISGIRRSWSSRRRCEGVGLTPGDLITRHVSEGGSGAAAVPRGADWRPGATIRRCW